MHNSYNLTLENKLFYFAVRVILSCSKLVMRITKQAFLNRSFTNESFMIYVSILRLLCPLGNICKLS